jgi:superoxide dismutase, Fe-Mn family
MAFELVSLPYAKDAFEPVISSRTMEFHHDKHHAAYVTKLNELVAGTQYETQDLETIIRSTARATDARQKQIYNNAGQVWNHNFFWESLAPMGGGHPPENIQKRIDDAFQSYENFCQRFVDIAVAQFGTGWAWLVSKPDGNLDIVSTADADVPFVTGLHPLLTIDVWEHAYYLDYQHERGRFVKAVLETHANWQLVSKRLAEKGQLAA